MQNVVVVVIMTDPIHHAATANHHPNGVGATAVLPVVSAATALLSVSLYVTAALAQCVMAAHYHQQPGKSAGEVWCAYDNTNCLGMAINDTSGT